MRVIVAGTRTITDAALVVRALERSGFDVATLIHGGARGVDELAGEWAATRGIPTEIYRADWFAYGKAAGPMRNRRMAEVGEALVAVWDGVSPGTYDMIRQATDRGLKIHVERV